MPKTSSADFGQLKRFLWKKFRQQTNVSNDVCLLSESNSQPRFGVAARCAWWLRPLVQSNIYGEFDPGSGRTLAACLTHASRTMKPGACSWWISGERVSNT